MRRYLLFAACGIVVCMTIGFVLTRAEPGLREHDAPQTVSIAGIHVRVEIADSDPERARGLSGHAPLSDDEGMLFVFPEDEHYTFWMHDMTFPIDIIWIDAGGVIVHIEENVLPESYPATFTPDSPARYVLEVRAGFATEHEIGVGSKFDDFPSTK